MSVKSMGSSVKVEDAEVNPVLWQSEDGKGDVRLVYVPGRKPRPNIVSSGDERYVIEVRTSYDATRKPNWEDVRWQGKSRRLYAIDTIAAAFGEFLRKAE